MKITYALIVSVWIFSCLIGGIEVYASDAPTKNPTINPTKNPTKNPTSAPTRPPTSAPTATPTSAPTGTPTKKPTVNPTLNPTKEPTDRPTKEPTGTPTLSPTKKPSEKPTREPTEAPTLSPTERPTKVPTPTESPSAAPTETTYEEVLNFDIVVVANTTLESIEDAFTEATEAILTNEVVGSDVAVRRELLQGQMPLGRLVRLLQDDSSTLPNGCDPAEEGWSDDQCKATTKAKFSYLCKSDSSYVCCKKKQGLVINSSVGKCQRNKDGEPPEGAIPTFDPTVNSISSSAKEIDCVEDAGLSPEDKEGTKCVRVVVTLSGTDEEDLVYFQEEIAAAVEDEVFDAEIAANALQAVVVLLPISEEPSASPSASPTVNTTNVPSASPTFGEDPCPLLTGDCKACVTNDACLFCRGNGVCFNTNPDVRPSTTGGDLSRRLDEVLENVDVVEEECIGTITASALVCDIPDPEETPAPTMAPVNVTFAPTLRPTVKPTPIASGASSVTSEWRTWNIVVPGVFSIILLALA